MMTSRNKHDYFTYKQLTHCSKDVRPSSNAITSSKRYTCPSLPAQIEQQNTQSFLGKTKENFTPPPTPSSSSSSPLLSAVMIDDDATAPKPLAPLFDPLFNVREILKEILLLEKHLNLEWLQCIECIKKHFLTIEGYLEEAVSLDEENLYRRQLDQWAWQVRELETQWWKSRDDPSSFSDIAQRLRQLRKQLMEKFPDIIDVEWIMYHDPDKKLSCNSNACRLKK